MTIRRYRVSWEAPDVVVPAYFEGWHPVEKEHNSLMEAVDQFLTLKGWEISGEGPVRNVKLEEGVIEWKEKPVPDEFLKEYGVKPDAIS